MQRMFNLRKWTEMTEGTAVSFAGTRPRIVNLEVNAPSEVCLYLKYPESDETYFLALVRGRDKIETYVDGAFEVLSEGGVCYIYTADGDDISSVVLEPVIFTRIAERRARNPELEAIERRMFLNQQKRLDAQMAEFDRRLKAEREYYVGRDAQQGVRNRDASEGAASGSGDVAKAAASGDAGGGGKSEGGSVSGSPTGADASGGAAIKPAKDAGK